jgi:hypothetical protein
MKEIKAGMWMQSSDSGHYIVNDLGIEDKRHFYDYVAFFKDGSALFLTHGDIQKTIVNNSRVGHATEGLMKRAIRAVYGELE